MFGYFTGGIIGSNYTGSILTQPISGNGALYSECKNNKVIPSAYIQYKQNSVNIENYADLTLGKKTLDYMIENSKFYYTYQNSKTATELKDITIENKVLGLVVALDYLTYSNDIEYSDYIVKKTDGKFNIHYNKQDGYIKFNPTDTNNYPLNIGTIANNVGTGEFDAKLKLGITSEDDIVYGFNPNNVVEGKNLELDKVMYIVGVQGVSMYNTWNNEYSEQYVLFS